jgi:hypothetical protein
LRERVASIRRCEPGEGKLLLLCSEYRERLIPDVASVILGYALARLATGHDPRLVPAAALDAIDMSGCGLSV